jgi:hypothetical protein
VEAPAVNDVEESTGELEEEDYKSEDGDETGHGTMQEDEENPNDDGVVDKVGKMDHPEVQKEGDTNDDKSEGKNHDTPEGEDVVQVRENNNATGAAKNNHDVAEGQAAGPDTQDMDCEPFKASDGPSHDDTAVEQERQKDSPVPTAK